MIIKVDYREKKLLTMLNAKLEELELKHITIIIESLPLGDIIICDDKCIEQIIIERKSLNDLAASIRDGRYAEQSFRLDNHEIHNHNIIYLIEGDIHRYSDKYSKIKKKTLQVTMFCINYFKGFSIMKTRDILETAEYILIITDKLRRETVRKNYYKNNQIETDGNIFENEKLHLNSNIRSESPKKRYSEVISKVKKKNIRPDNIGEIILSQIPGISSKTSAAIMQNFSSLYELLTTLQKDCKCLNEITIKSKNGKRRLSQSIISNIKTYLLYNKDSVVIKITT
jgi:crossover junction endonuclease MUS81